MKIASLNEIKKELNTFSPDKIRDICLRLARQKKETKELLHYLLFEATDEAAFIAAIKEEIQEGFQEINLANLYWAKKSIRKLLRNLNKYIRFSGNKQTEAELRIFFCGQVQGLGINIRRSQALYNLYERQVKLIQKAVGQLHPDLQFDYEGDLEEVSSIIN